jgi:hypothetical protein
MSLDAFLRSLYGKDDATNSRVFAESDAEDRLPRRFSGAKGPFLHLRMDDLFSVPVVTPLRNA